ncbi:DUF4254 domain-containing protein [Paraflavitalea pollutisoli]|uniref:DUF4254 domain-containing protein n=1 Tax=Paraflavitalea pollutisoli TaxID=3034143 RepID=UPI0023EDDE97|nr:DUF4254 domain-containing protein [Paraflavitalea sp. H1-2-19X]
MDTISQHCYTVFERAVCDYHLFDDVDRFVQNPFGQGTLDALLYEKSWIDTVQWHLEDMVRDPAIDPGYALAIKRRIDHLNQQRTDRVEQIDDHFQEAYCQVVPLAGARHNSESLGWAIDRLSILTLKVYHTGVELERSGVSADHQDKCMARMRILSAQKEDLLLAINWLQEDVSTGVKVNKVYRQLKMYNDPAFNPVLYAKRSVSVD